MSDSHEEWARSIKAAVEQRMRFIATNRERLIEAWIAETGLSPSESQIVEQRHDDGTTTVMVRRGALPPHPLYVEMLALLRELSDWTLCEHGNDGECCHARARALLERIDKPTAA